MLSGNPVEIGLSVSGPMRALPFPGGVKEEVVCETWEFRPTRKFKTGSVKRVKHLGRNPSRITSWN